MDKIAGVYQIKNLVNGKIYIGSSVDIHNRWAVHKMRLRKGVHRNSHLKSAWNKYGEENFEFTILEVVEDRCDAVIREQKYLDYYLPEYNMVHRAEATNLGKSIPQDVRDKISKTKIKNGDSKGENNPFYGKTHSKETRKRLSDIAKKRKHSKEWKDKVAMTLMGENSHYAKLNWNTVNEIRELFESGQYTEAELVRMYNMSQSAINKLLRYKTWRVE